jgi:outer membrane receptor for ferrienterochelin and colicin
LNYSYDVEEPSINYLFPMPSLNINYKTLGNPNLEPEHSHDVEMSLWYWNRAKMSNISLRAEAQFYTNQIVYNQTTEMVDGIGYVTFSIPENLKGGRVYSTYLWSNFPIVKTILSMNISINGSISDNPTYINEIKNITNTKYAGGSIGLNITAGEKLSFNAGGSAYVTFTKYSIQKDRNQNYMNYSARAGFKWQVFKKTFLEGNYGFSYYDNKKMEFNQNIHTLNVSIRQVIGKKNQFEIRLAGIDLLNQNQYIRQTTSVNYVEYRISPTLARYFLVTFAYNLRGFDLESKNRMFF